MEQIPHSAEEEALTGKLHELLGEPENEETEQFCFREEMIEEVMQELYKEIAFCDGTLPPNPTPVFIDEGKNGSCGASVSGSASTVMAGIEVFSSTGGFPVTENGSAVVEVEDGNDASFEFGFGFGFGEGMKMEEFDEWVGRVLSCGQQNQVQVV